MAMQQGGLGLILTVLIVTAPPMAASFFSGVLGQFSAYNQFSNPNIPPGQNDMRQAAGKYPVAEGRQTAPAAMPFQAHSATSATSVRDEIRVPQRHAPAGEGASS